MTMFSDALASGFAAVEEIAGQSIQIVRGCLATESWGVLGESEAASSDGGGGTVIESRSIDWLIAIGKYKNGEASTRPFIGDVIETQTGRRFQVQAPSGMPVWRYSDPRRTHYRVHCIEVTGAV
jgi:hypothetical protein